jgi:S1-C subfamily serine protease
MSELKPLEAQQLLRNTASAWGPDSELRGKVGASVWQKIAPAQANPVQSLRAVSEIAEYGITPSDVKAYPRLLVAKSLPTGTELGVNFTTGHDASLPSVEAFAAAPAGGPAVLVEVQSTASRRQIVDKKEESSEYKSGTRAVPNPQYAIAQMNCQRAQSELAAQQTRNAIAPARGWGILLQGIVEGLSQASVTTVCNEFAATSASLQEDVFTPYSYTVSEIEVIRSAQGRIVSVDSARGIVDTYPLAIEDKARHHVAYGRKSTDRGLSSKSITDAELETLASKPLAIDAKAVVLALNEESKKTYTQAELPTILAQRPAEPTTIRPTLLANTGPAPDRPPPGPTATTSQPSRHAAYTPAALQPQAPEAANLDARMGSVVVVLNPKGMIGAGFYVDSNEILTNYHVVEGASTIELRALDSQLFTGRVIKKDIGLDLALIKVERVGQPLAFSQAIVKAGDTVEAVGHPKGLFFSVSRGIVSAVRQMKGALAQGGDKALVIQTDTPINPGNSGGPLFLKDRVIGINTLKFRNSEGIGFAVHYAEVVKFLSQQ